MKCSVKTVKDRVYVLLKDKITAQDVKGIKEKLDEAAAKWSDKEWFLDCGELQYISSGGLRMLLSFQRKLQNKIHIFDVQQNVMDIFTLTGFDKLFSIKKGMRRISVKGCDVVGRGANGEVYRLQDETIVKVYYPGVDLKSIERENEISHAVFELGLPAAIPYDTVMVDGGRYGIVHEILGNRTLSEKIEENPERFDEWITEYVNLFKLVHETDGSQSILPSAKEVYHRHLTESAEWYSQEELAQLLKLLECIPDQSTLVHGDYHPNNIMVIDGELIMIDLGDFSVGHPVFDFLATAATQANLVDLSPEFAETHTRMKADRIRKGWSALLDQCFPDRTPSERSRIDAQIRLLSRLKVACAPAVAKGISEQLMRDSVNDVKEHLIPRIDELISTIEWW